MMKKQILVLFDLLLEQFDEMKELAFEHEFIYSIEEIDVERLEVIIGWTNELTAIIEEDASIVKWIQYPYAGVNTLPLALFEEKGISLTNGSGVHTYAVSESAIGLLLSMTRNIVTSAKYQAQGKWQKTSNFYELFGKTMMIVGTGKIGIHLGQIAKGFGMQTIGINRSGRTVKNMDKQYVQKDLLEVIHEADIIVNILPATKETKQLFNTEMFSKMKEDTMFINVGRGETVDTVALLAALDNDTLLFAGLDVFEEEPLVEGHPLWKHEKVILTPHIAGNVESYPKHFYPIIKKNLEAFLSNKELPENLVELENGY